MSLTTTETVSALDVPDSGQASGQSSASVSPQVLRLKLQKTDKKKADESQKKVKFTDQTVDNEGMGRKKSKCCCIYHKPHNFDQSSDSDDSDLESDHCFGHKCQNKSHSTQA